LGFFVCRSKVILWVAFLMEEGMKFRTSWVLTCTVACLAICVQAEPAIFKDADHKLGEKLIADSQCVACHVGKVGGDGSAIYKPLGRINNAALLRGMVEQCNTELNLGMFPEEVSSIAAVLNRSHYKFK
jgi:hypothetical protein